MTKRKENKMENEYKYVAIKQSYTPSNTIVTITLPPRTSQKALQSLALLAVQYYVNGSSSFATGKDGSMIFEFNFFDKPGAEEFCKTADNIVAYYQPYSLKITPKTDGSGKDFDFSLGWDFAFTVLERLSKIAKPFFKTVEEFGGYDTALNAMLSGKVPQTPELKKAVDLISNLFLQILLGFENGEFTSALEPYFKY